MPDWRPRQLLVEGTRSLRAPRRQSPHAAAGARPFLSRHTQMRCRFARASPARVLGLDSAPSPGAACRSAPYGMPWRGGGRRRRRRRPNRRVPPEPEQRARQAAHRRHARDALGCLGRARVPQARRPRRGARGARQPPRVCAHAGHGLEPAARRVLPQTVVGRARMPPSPPEDGQTPMTDYPAG